MNLLHKREKNENVLNGIFYFGAVIITVLIIFTVNLKSVPITLALFGCVSCLMAAVNNVITSVVPLYSRDKIAELIKTDSRLATEVNDIKNLILKK